MKMRILSAILVVSGLSIVAFAESPNTGKEESVDMEDKYPEVLLEDAVKEFERAYTKTAKLLKQARDNYANAINEIEKALAVINE